MIKENMDLFELSTEDEKEGNPIISYSKMERLLLDLSFRDLPRYVNHKDSYIRWGVKRRLERKDASFDAFLFRESETI